MFWNAVSLALREIRRNVLRSSLTILGIVIGVAAVITMVTIGEGATAQVRSDIQKLGTNLLQVFRGQGFGGGGARSTAAPFTLEDAWAIRDEVSGVRAVAPTASTMSQAIYGNANWSTQITGSTDQFLVVRDWALALGRNFSDHDLRVGAAVCLLGQTVRKELFGEQDPVGANIRLQKVSCEVIGVLSAKGQSGFGQDQDDSVIVPLRMLQRRLAGNADVTGIMVSARDGVSTEKVQSDIERLLRERRKIRQGAENDFNVRDLKEIASAFTSSTRVMTALLGAVAAVSLVVGGVGIMNIMLVSVTERTREIGTRLAVGAMAKDVLLQFLVEAVTLAAMGGVIGIVLGLSAGALATSMFGVPFVFNPGIVMLSFAFAAVVGIVFGYFPARRAAQMDPIEALRHE
ncbi:multidrug ABC transporter substrate-binding protein [Steroidobacter denitrificans]|uniref:Multidrug ABC transporter substrate-binding protein n=1 Tax=Steroidobacter denitrificans TaxID=465721 RepID=A0A127FET9_STEDE|nr:ABC transporter permease [Steroidobacter denitrificans]AMN48388.1 multidrug ABC transporter substrate-binding protein [Steroidobacter denitrificans]